MNLRLRQPKNGAETYAAMWQDNVVPTERTPCVMFGGLGSAASHMFTRPAGITDQLDLTLSTLARRRATGACQVGSKWGHSDDRTRLGTFLTYATANLGWPAGPVHIYGASGGALLALKFAQFFPHRVKSMVVAIAPNDIQAVYAGNRGGWTAASISAAYGGSPSNDENPADNTDSIKTSGIPLLYIYSGSDPYVTLAEHEAYIAATECESLYMGDEVGHALEFDYGVISAWFDENEQGFFHRG